jgi:hypothetical protein
MRRREFIAGVAVRAGAQQPKLPVTDTSRRMREFFNRHLN